MTLYLVWQKGRSTASGQRALLGIYSTHEAAVRAANDSDRVITEEQLDDEVKK